MADHIFKAIVSNNFMEVYRLLKEGIDANSLNEFGDSALYYALSVGSEGVVPLLLEYGADVRSLNTRRQTPLFAASTAAAVLALLEAGANILARDEEGDTPLHHAAARGWTEAVITLLANGADVYALGGKGHGKELPAPYRAFDADNPHGVLSAFRVAGYDFSGINGDYTPLHYLVAKSHAHLIPWLLRNGARPEFVDSEGRTAREYLDYLYDQPKDIRDDWGWTREDLDAVRRALDRWEGSLI